MERCDNYIASRYERASTKAKDVDNLVWLFQQTGCYRCNGYKTKRDCNKFTTETGLGKIKIDTDFSS